MHQWALPTIAVMLLAYGAVSGRLRSTPVSQVSPSCRTPTPSRIRSI